MWAEPESLIVLIQHLSWPSPVSPSVWHTKHQKLFGHCHLKKLQMSNSTQGCNLFLRDLQSKQGFVPGIAATVKQHKMPCPKERIFCCFLCVPPSFWHRHHASDAFKGQTHNFKNIHVLPFLSSCTNKYTWQEYFENPNKHLLHLLQYLQRLACFLQEKELLAKNPSFLFRYTKLYK